MRLNAATAYCVHEFTDFCFLCGIICACFINGFVWCAGGGSTGTDVMEATEAPAGTEDFTKSTQFLVGGSD